jgi:hypothetical protein
LEESASFAFSMADFDAIWEDYLRHWCKMSMERYIELYEENHRK